MPWGELDQQVNIAGWGEIITQCGAEDREPDDRVSSTELGDAFARDAVERERHEGMIEAVGGAVPLRSELGDGTLLLPVERERPSAATF